MLSCNIGNYLIKRQSERYIVINFQFQNKYYMVFTRYFKVLKIITHKNVPQTMNI